MSMVDMEVIDILTLKMVILSILTPSFCGMYVDASHILGSFKCGDEHEM